MKIYCAKCGKYLGEIRDATLRKKIYFICWPCEQERKAGDIFSFLNVKD